MFALRLVEHPPHDAVVHVEDLIGDRRLGIEQDGNQRRLPQGQATPTLCGNTSR